MLLMDSGKAWRIDTPSAIHVSAFSISTLLSKEH
jgi:hypothetical protein